MKSQATFRPFEPDQLFLLPPDMKDWLPEGDLVFFISDLVGQLDLSAIYDAYDGSRGGQPPYHPRMMTALLLYAYCKGVPSSRKIEQATHDSVAFRVLTANQQPDHDTIAEFRRRHLKALAGLFVQILRLCQQAGLVKLGHVSLDGTKVRANASKHKAMSYDRMEKKAAELRKEVERLLAEADRVDAEEDALYGKGRRGDELPDELQRRETRLAKIEQAMAELEAEAKGRADAQRAEQREKAEACEREGKKPRGKKPKPPDDKPPPKSQRNFTDPESRIMKDGASKSFEQAYNCQAAVDAEAQVIVSTNVTQQTNDKQQVTPLIENLKTNTDGEKPRVASADSGYFSEANIDYLADETIDAYVATGRLKHDETPPPAPRGRIPHNATTKERMARKLRTMKGRATYKRRKAIVEPVFGQIKEARGLRRFSLRGLSNVTAEWELICLTHNVLKLFRGGATIQTR